MDVFIEGGKDPHKASLAFHVNLEISDDNQRTIYRHDYRGRLQEIHQNCGLTAVKIVRYLFTVPGVVEVEISTYKLTVTKAPAFSWVEIKPSIIDALRVALNVEVSYIDIETTDKIELAIEPLSVPVVITKNIDRNDLPPAELIRGDTQA